MNRIRITLTTILTLNINSIKSPLKVDILLKTLHQNDVDIALLQEVALPDLSLPGYNIINNTTDALGTAIAIKEDIPYSNEIRTSDSRGIAVTIGHTKIINVYAPSGSQCKKEREIFFSQTIAPLFDQPAENLIIGGDFNSVLKPEDSLNSFNYCHSLKLMTNGLNMTDSWTELKPNDKGYTYFRTNSASRIDRIYVSEGIKTQLRYVQLIITEISDHNGLICKIRIGERYTTVRKKQWYVNKNFLNSEHIDIDLLKIKYKFWQRHKNKFDNIIHWWTKYLKPQLTKYIKWKTNM